MYNKNIGDIALWRFPVFLEKFTKSFAGNILLSSHITDRGTNSMPEPVSSIYQSNVYSDFSNMFGQPQNENMPNLNPGAAAATTTRTQDAEPAGVEPEASDLADQIAQLQSMFPDSSRERIIIALQSSNYDPNRAASSLLEFS
ncbi:hypothetical protein AYI68_g6527 [Smittium mucronatum]|uniref:CUE domain-containing protein n=1 Tax=Smittium mucronatum TaxID=133383 RepID=A0A1R0GRA0_9FUNG|nr:hypothetical protein AYI68_g6527 [Smittium mucronatum]